MKLANKVASMRTNRIFYKYLIYDKYFGIFEICDLVRGNMHGFYYLPLLMRCIKNTYKVQIKIYRRSYSSVEPTDNFLFACPSLTRSGGITGIPFRTFNNKSPL